MKKVIFVFMMWIILSPIMYLPVFADDGREYDLFFDFEGYNAPLRQGILPDEKYWGYYTPNESRKNFGSYDTNDPEHGTVLKVVHAGEPFLKFGQTLKKGNMHISFEAKATSPQKRLVLHFYDGRNEGDVITNPDYYSKTFFLNSPAPNQIRYFQTSPGTANGNSLINWNAIVLDWEYDSTQWHRFDIIATDLESPNGKMFYFMDGKRMNEYPIYFSGSQGFLTFCFKGETVSGGMYINDEGFLIDNVSFKRVFRPLGIEATAIDTDRVALENGRLSVRLSELTDADLLTKENIEIVNVSSNKKIDNYRITNATESGFVVEFEGELAPGRYELRMNNVIVGHLTGNPMQVPLTFYTEYRYENAFIESLKLDFNDYTAQDNALPNKFMNLENDEYIASSGIGASGEENDRAFGFESMAISETPTRFVLEFDEPIPEETGFEVEFDVLAQNCSWYLYLLENGDLDTGNPNYKKNSVISVNSSGNIYYAESRTEIPNKPIEDVQLSDEWHRVKIIVEPGLNSVSCNYIIKIDDQIERRVSVNRSLYKEKTVGIGFGYSTLVEGGKFYIDNLKVGYNLSVLYPEVIDISVYDNQGNKVNTDIKTTSLISKVVITFNTLIDEDIEEIVKVYQDNMEINYSYEFNTIDEKTALVLKFDEFLLPLSSYRINIGAGIKSKYVDYVTSTISYNVMFSTLQDVYFVVKDSGYDASTSSCTIEFSKNNGSKGKYIYSAIAFKNVSHTWEGKTVTVPQVVASNFVLITFDESDKGEYKITLPLNFTQEAGVEVKTFLWNYPQLSKVKVAKDGQIETK